VLVNLLSNAVKYTKEQGQIWLTIRREGNMAAVSVRDNGIGLAPDMLPRVFDLFAQASQGLDRSRGGLGIGLTLVRRIVEMHGGTISVTSPGEGQGSEFTVRLPAVDQQTASQTPQDEPAATRGQGLRILVVDDNRDAAQTLSMLLKASGHKTAVAFDGKRALELAADFRPDVALLDIGLPGMTGLELANLLRQDLPEVFLVAVSGYGHPEDRARSRAAGFDEHLVKPAALSELLSILNARKTAR